MWMLFLNESVFVWFYKLHHVHINDYNAHGMHSVHCVHCTLKMVHPTDPI